MTNKNVKQRDVLPFDEFVKAHETALKVVMTKKGENPNPGAHDIKGEDLYVRNDANPYKAFGIPHDEKIANANSQVSANQVDVQGKPHDGQDPTGAKTNEKEQPTAADKKAAEDAAAIVANAHGIVSTEGVSEGKKSE